MLIAKKHPNEHKNRKILCQFLESDETSSTNHIIILFALLVSSGMGPAGYRMWMLLAVPLERSPKGVYLVCAQGSPDSFFERRVLIFPFVL